MPLLFAYGSLKRGFRLHRHLRTAVFKGTACTERGYALYRLDWYPGMVVDAASACVTGELYEVPETLLPLLDEVEGVPDLYQRVTILVRCPEHAPETVVALTYLYQQPVDPYRRIMDGHWHEDDASGSGASE